MNYISSIFCQNGGNCHPLISSYRDSNGYQKAPTNVSVTSYKGNIIQNTRLTDYLYIPIQATDVIQYIPIIGDKNKTISCNAIGILNDNPLIYELMGNNISSLINDITYYGLEDVRLVVWNDTLYGIGFRPDIIKGKVIPQLVEYNDDLSINRSWFLNTDKQMEKNWQPIENMPFTFMYDPDKSFTITLDIDKLDVADNNDSPTIINWIETPEFSFSISGSTQLIRFNDDQYISICHTGHRYISPVGLEKWVYNHYFVIYDNDLNKLWTSEPFRFVCDCMEFTCGMCRHNNDIYITFTMYDGIPHVLSISFDKFQEIINNMMDKPGIYEGEPNDKYMVDSYMNNDISSISKLPYMFYLENIHRLENPNDIIELLESPNILKSIYDGILLFFITRRHDNQIILNEFKKYNEDY